MKKVLAILVVLALVCGAVFADTIPTQGDAEEHKITLHTTVGLVNPVFHLVETSVSAVKADDSALNDTTVRTTNSGNVKFVDGAEYTDVADVEVGDISKHDIVVLFDVKISNAAKLVKDFRLAFQATGFNVTRNGHEETTDEPTIEYSANENLVAADGVVMGTGANDHIAKFNGTTCSENGTTLASLTLTYAQDTTVDPTNDGADYKAIVTMTVTAQ